MRTFFLIGLVALSASHLTAQSSPPEQKPLAGTCDLLVRLSLNAPAPDLSLLRVADEIRAIWASHLAIRVTDTEASTPCDDEIRVMIDGVSASAGDALGWIHFIDGQPSHDAIVSLARARDLLNAAVWMGRAASEWPRDTYMRSLSQVIGRATAHEIGHYVLRTPTHASAGLMRPRLNAEDGLRPRGARFALPSLPRSTRGLD
jgi:hypothetical protein